MDGAAQWTEMGSERGLDPLAMLNAVEARYQSLLPGFSSVTTRLRNYSFNAWWLTHYVDQLHDPSREAFNHFVRRVEALYALASAQDLGETGVAGKEFADGKLASEAEVLNFRIETDAETPRERRYLAPLGGAFTGIYATQMTESGLLGRAEKHNLPVTTSAGRALAETFSASIGAAGEAFLRAADLGEVERSALAGMQVMRPSALDEESMEADLLRSLLMGEDGSRSSIARRASLLLILQTAKEARNEPVSEDFLRWRWVETEIGDEISETQRAWQHYQAGDTTRVVYEALLRHATRELEEYPGGLGMPNVCSLLASRLPDISLANCLEQIDEDRAGQTLAKIQAQALDAEASVVEILAPLARLRRMWHGRIEELAESYPDRPGYQTCYSELRWLEERKSVPAQTAIAELLRQRILRRHLEVAARKFHINRRYTFLVEIEDARIRARNTTDVERSRPRLGTALKFLSDVDFLEAGRLAPKGEVYLEAI